MINFTLCLIIIFSCHDLFSQEEEKKDKDGKYHLAVFSGYTFDNSDRKGYKIGIEI